MLFDPTPVPDWVSWHRLGKTLNPVNWLGLQNHFFSTTPPRNTKLRSLSIDTTIFPLPEKVHNSPQGLVDGRFILLNLDVTLGWPLEWGRLRHTAIPSEWRLAFHSHEFLKELLREQDKDRAHHTIWQLIQKWIEQYPEPSAANQLDAWQPLATARRLVVWSELTYLIPPPDSLIRDFILSYVRQTKWLRRFLLNGQNHLNNVTKAVALATAGCFFEGPWADAIRREGLGFLDYSLDLLTTPNGNINTRTPSHLIELSRQLATLGEWLRQVDRRVAARYFSWSKTLNDSGDMLRHPDGTLPQFNGTTNDRVAPKFLPRTPLTTICSDYAVYRSADFNLIFDGGPLSVSRPNPFGHAAPLNFELSFRRQRIFVDSGWCAATGERHRVFREPNAHNTLIVAGKRAGRFTRSGLSAAPLFRPPRIIGNPLGTWILASHSYYANKGVARLLRVWFIAANGGCIASVHIGFGKGRVKNLQEFLQLNHGFTPHAISPHAFGIEAEEALVLQVHPTAEVRLNAGQVSQYQHVQLSSSILELQQTAKPPFLMAWSLHKGTTTLPFDVMLQDKMLRITHPSIGTDQAVSLTLG